MSAQINRITLDRALVPAHSPRSQKVTLQAFKALAARGLTFKVPTGGTLTVLTSKGCGETAKNLRLSANDFWVACHDFLGALVEHSQREPLPAGHYRLNLALQQFQAQQSIGEIMGSPAVLIRTGNTPAPQLIAAPPTVEPLDPATQFLLYTTPERSGVPVSAETPKGRSAFLDALSAGADWAQKAVAAVTGNADPIVTKGIIWAVNTDQLHLLWGGKFEYLKQIEFALVQQLTAEHLLNPAPKVSGDRQYAAEPMTKLAAARSRYQRESIFTALRQGEFAVEIVAGGQGTRAGLTRPKGMIQISPVTHKPLFQIFAEKILKVNRTHRTNLPLFIFTNEAIQRTVLEYFTLQRYFGLGKENVFIFPCDMLPSVRPDGKIILEDNGKVSLSPRGHGRVLSRLYEAYGKEIEQRGIKHFSHIQVDNPLARPFDPVFLAAHLGNRALFSTKAVARTREWEKVGMVGINIATEQSEIVEYMNLSQADKYARNIGGHSVVVLKKDGAYRLESLDHYKAKTAEIDALPDLTLSARDELKEKKMGVLCSVLTAKEAAEANEKRPIEILPEDVELDFAGTRYRAAELRRYPLFWSAGNTSNHLIAWEAVKRMMESGQDLPITVQRKQVKTYLKDMNLYGLPVVLEREEDGKVHLLVNGESVTVDVPPVDPQMRTFRESNLSLPGITEKIGLGRTGRQDQPGRLYFTIPGVKFERFTHDMLLMLPELYPNAPSQPTLEIPRGDEASSPGFGPYKNEDDPTGNAVSDDSFSAAQQLMVVDASHKLRVAGAKFIDRGGKTVASLPIIRLKDVAPASKGAERLTIVGNSIELSEAFVSSYDEAMERIGPGMTIEEGFGQFYLSGNNTRIGKNFSLKGNVDSCVVLFGEMSEDPHGKNIYHADPAAEYMGSVTIGDNVTIGGPGCDDRISVEIAIQRRGKVIFEPNARITWDIKELVEDHEILYVRTDGTCEKYRREG